MIGQCIQQSGLCNLCVSAQHMCQGGEFEDDILFRHEEKASVNWHNAHYLLSWKSNIDIRAIRNYLWHYSYFLKIQHIIINYQLHKVSKIESLLVNLLIILPNKTNIKNSSAGTGEMSISVVTNTGCSSRRSMMQPSTTQRLKGRHNSSFCGSGAVLRCP